MHKSRKLNNSCKITRRSPIFLSGSSIYLQAFLLYKKSNGILAFFAGGGVVCCAAWSLGKREENDYYANKLVQNVE